MIFKYAHDICECAPDTTNDFFLRFRLYFDMYARAIDLDCNFIRVAVAGSYTFGISQTHILGFYLGCV